jgi:DNA helicase-2/ATP-dependent DNA helicase PcrA
MRSVVLASDDPGLERLGTTAVGSVAASALKIARAMRENGRTAGEVADYAAEVAARADEIEARSAKPFTQALRGTNLQLERLEQLSVYARLAEVYEARKVELGAIEFTDQVAYAAQIIALDPAIAEEVRGATRQVILDEYQDTSVGQTRLFAELFGHQAVMAVGDPKQSIYAWRGASAANMKRFAADFANGSEYHQFTLTTSWRNDREILRVANTIAAPLPATERGEELKAAAKAGEGEVHIRHFLTEPDEAKHVAEWFAGKLAQAPDATGAVLVRARSSMAAYAQALHEAGVPHQVIGLGGLVRTPEVVDLTSLLRAAADEYAGSELLRLLLGARFEVGLADVHQLSELAGALTRLGADGRKLDEQRSRAVRDDIRDTETGTSLAEALEFVRTATSETVRRFVPELTDEGERRLRDAGTLISRVRGAMDLPLVDWVTTTISLSRLRIETAANPRNAVAAANLDAFVDAVVQYASAVPDADVHEFLDWLELTFRDDQLAEYSPTPPKQGIVQLTTIHSAKGLEWDYVALGNLAKGKLPGPQGVNQLVGSGQLPNALREDREDLPHLPLGKIETDEDLKRHFKDAPTHDRAGAGNEREQPFVTQKFLQLIREDRRLAYVAMTRAKHGLLLTSARWKPGLKTPSTPSMFQLELRDSLPLEHTEFDAPWARIDDKPVVFTLAQLEEEKDEDLKAIKDALSTNPLEGDAVPQAWPPSPMARGDLATATELASAVGAAAESAEPADIESPYDALIELLVAEREQANRPPELRLPSRFGASLLHDLFDDPAAIARNAARPMPSRPYRATLVGNLFHSWVESLYEDVAGGGAALEGADLDDADFSSASLTQLDDDDRQRLEQLQSTFLASRFTAGGRRPSAVELPVDAPLGEFTVVNKIDAVYRDDDGTIEIVDWKTGRAPRTAEERRGREYQLMSYAHAYAASFDEPIERIRATLYYVADDLEISVTELLSVDELVELLRDAQGRVAQAG